MALCGPTGRLTGVALLAATLLGLANSPADATKIERVVSPGGIEAWVVREPSPLIAVEFAFEGGTLRRVRPVLAGRVFAQQAEYAAHFRQG